MSMDSLEVLVISNLQSILDYYNLENSQAISYYININYSTLRSWFSHERTPSLKTLDSICDKLFIPTYILFLRDIDESHISKAIDAKIKNNSPKTLRVNLKKVYNDRNKDSWNDIEALFYGLISIETLKSYHRSNNPITPPIKTLSIMSTYLGIQPHQLLRKDV